MADTLETSTDNVVAGEEHNEPVVEPSDPVVDPSDSVDEPREPVVEIVNKPVIDIQIVSDFVCPWCWVAKRRLERVMVTLSKQFEFHVTWEPFLLHPESPMEGIPHHQPRGGDPEDPGIQLLNEISIDLGIDFTFRCPVWPDTTAAHVLVEYSKTVNDGANMSQVVDRLYRAYFTKGRTLERRHLLAVAEDVGFNLRDVDKYLDEVERHKEVVQRAEAWRSKGVEAIPFMIMNGYSAFSGDQDESALISTINKVVSRLTMEQEDTSL